MNITKLPVTDHRIEIIEYTWGDEFIGAAPDLIAAGLANIHMFPVLPKRVRHSDCSTSREDLFRVERVRGGRFKLTRWRDTPRPLAMTETKGQTKVVELALVREDPDNRRMLTDLMNLEVAGEIAGIVTIVIFKPGASVRFDLRTSGAADDNLTLALGAMAACQALLQEQALEQSGLLL